MDHEWGPWIEHDGRGCPVPAGTVVNVEWCCGDKDIHVVPIETANCPRNMTTCWHWALWRSETLNKYARVIRYRIRKPRGLLILEQILADLPQPVEPVHG